jgi:hypothetical protein
MVRKQKRQQRLNDELVAISEHLLYEIQMLFGTAQALSTIEHSNRNDFENSVMYNALLESFTVHTRILLDFLYSTNPYPDDAIAEDFFDDDKAWVQFRPAESSLLNSIHYNVGKRVAHLTYARLKVKSKEESWKYLGISEEISEILSKFLHLVPASRISESFREFISRTVDAEEIKVILNMYPKPNEPGGVSLSLNPATYSLMDWYLKLSPVDRLQLVREARRLAEEKEER